MSQDHSMQNYKLWRNVSLSKMTLNGLPASLPLSLETQEASFHLNGCESARPPVRPPLPHNNNFPISQSSSSSFEAINFRKENFKFRDDYHASPESAPSELQGQHVMGGWCMFLERPVTSPQNVPFRHFSSPCQEDGISPNLPQNSSRDHAYVSNCPLGL